MKIYGADNKELMSITSLSREGSALVVKGKIFGATLSSSLRSVLPDTGSSPSPRRSGS